MYAEQTPLATTDKVHETTPTMDTIRLKSPATMSGLGASRRTLLRQGHNNNRQYTKHENKQ